MINSFTGKYAFLSNFWNCNIHYEGIDYPSSEHAYQAAKSLDPAIRQSIARLSSAGKAKRAGMAIDLRPNWEQIKLAVMQDILEIKFQDSDLKQRLINTGNEESIEGNTWGDIFLGVCRREGENWLGVLLMRLRERLVFGTAKISDPTYRENRSY